MIIDILMIESQFQDEALFWFNDKEKELNNFEEFVNKFLVHLWGSFSTKIY